MGKFQTITRFLYPYRRRLAGLIILTAGLSALVMLPPLLIRGVINKVIGEGRHSLLFTLGCLMIATHIVHAFSVFFQTLGIAYLGQKFVMDIRCALYEHLVRLSMRFHSKHNVGMLANRLMGDTGVLQHMLSVTSVQTVSDFVCSAFAITVTFTLNWRLAVFLVALVILFVLNYRINIAGIRRVTRSHRTAEDRVADGIQNRLAANLTVKSFGAEEREHADFRDQSDMSLDLMKESLYASNTFHMNTMLLRDLGRIVIYFLGCFMVLKNSASYGDVIAFTSYSMQLLMPAVRFSALAQQIQNVRISLERLFELLDEKPDVSARPGAVKLGRVQGRVDFDNVTFWYEEGRPVLRDVDFHAQPGERVALVGRTGSGKTTILSLLLRFFDAQQGAVRIDGIDVRDVQLGSLRSRFGIVLQESLLFDTTVAENIRYSSPTAALDDVIKAAQIAEIHDAILALPNGYDTRIGWGEVELSVGQKQRISIARAVLSDPAIIIMDEATSALDSESERAIQIAMNHFLVGRTSFIVAHRLSTIRNADRIILLDNGQIQEMGTHKQLMKIRKGKYRDLYNRHAGKGVIVDE